MKKIQCEECGTEWYPQHLACCPRCLATKWLSAPEMVVNQQGSFSPPASFPAIRSPLSIEMIDDEGMFLFYAAANGITYYDPAGEIYVCFVPAPVGIIPGSAVPASEPVPAAATDRLLILDAFGPDPRAYTCNPDEFKGEIDSGRFSPMPACEGPGCENLSLPYRKRCVQHN